MHGAEYMTRYSYVVVKTLFLSKNTHAIICVTSFTEIIIKDVEIWYYSAHEKINISSYKIEKKHQVFL